MSELSPISRTSIGARTQGGETPWGAFSTRRNRPAGEPNEKAQAGGASNPDLDPATKEQITKLEARDREVRAHEAAHKSAAGSLAGGAATFEYERGPDGKLYAVGGEVQISTSKGRSPEETIQKARQVRAAALAPAQPSGQDMAVAARAASMEQQAAKEKQSAPAESEGQMPNSRFAIYAKHSSPLPSLEDSFSVVA